MSKMLQISCFLIVFFTCTPFSLLNATDETTATDFLTLRRGNSQGDAREEDNSENAIKIQDTVKTPLVHDDEVQDWTGSFQSHEQMTQFFQSERDTTVSLMEVTSGAHSETSTEATTSTTLSTSSTRPTLPTLSTASEVDSLTENTTIPDILTHSLSSEEIPIIPSDKASPEATLRTFSTNVAETTFSQSTELSSTASTTSIFSTKPSTLETTQIPPIKSQMDGISSHPSTRSRMINATFSTQLKSTKLSNYSSTKEKEQPILRSTEKQSTVFISLFPSAATTPVKENLEIKENVVTKAETTTQYSDKQKDNTKKKRKDTIQERKSEAFMSRKATATDSTNNKKNKINEIQTKQGSPGPQGPPGPVGPPGPAGKKGDPGPPGECKCDNAAGSSIRMQAAVSAVLTQHFGPSKDVIIPFDLELMDLADNYDNNTGIFFCSIPGIYVISLYLMSHPGSKVNARIFVNSRPVAALWADDNKDAGFYPSASIQMINRLEFGDQVYVMLVDGGYGESWVHANYNVFTLYLLYEDMFSV